MAQLVVPPEPSYRRKVYDELRGVNFSADPSLVDKRHSPDALNMISDNGGNPVKRRGWKAIAENSNGSIDNVWTFQIKNKMRILATSGDKLYEVEVTHVDPAEPDYNTATYSMTLKANLTSAGKKYGFRAQTPNHDGFFILDGTAYKYAYDLGGSLYVTNVVPKVPIVIINRDPSSGGGVAYEDINMLTRERIDEFIATDGTQNYTITATGVQGTPKIYYRTNTNPDTWTQDSGTISVTGNVVSTTSTFSDLVTDAGNVRVEYTATGDGKAGNVLGCKVGASFSKGATDQFFVSGNDSLTQYVYYSGLGDPTYFPENNYIFVGGSSTRIMGFLNIGEYLAVIKETAENDSAVFLIYPTSFQTRSVSNTSGNETTTTTTTEYTYAIKRATAGTGACSHYGFAVLNDEPLFLSNHGIHGIVSTNITSEKIIRNRSAFIDEKLTKEDGLENAIATVFDNYYFLAINGHAYVLDGRHKESDVKNNTSYIYESYYWDNIPAISISTYDKEFFFGTSDGRVCRFKNTGSAGDYSDEPVVGSDEKLPITARWSTPDDNDGVTEYFKTMLKKGSMCTVAPYERSSVSVYIIADSKVREFVGTATVDIWGGFDDIEFSVLSFDSRVAPRDYFWRKKKKKYKRLQIILENDVVDEPFGVFEIIKTYIITRFAK